MESAKTSQPAGAASQSQRKLSAKEILADIREEMSDRDLEQKYRLSPAGRENLFKQLVAKGLMTEADVRRRSESRNSDQASGNTRPSQAALSTTAVDAKNRPILTKSSSKADSSASLPLRKKENGISTTPRLPFVTTVLSSFSLYDIKIVGVGAILGGLCAAVVTSYWGTTKTWTKYLGKTQGTTSWKWIIACAILGAILAFCVNWILKKRRTATRQPSPTPQVVRSNHPVSVEEIEEAIRKMQKARRDMFGIAGDVGILGIGAAGGGIAAVAVAAFFGATSIWGITRAGKWLGLSVHGSTPWTWIIGCAIVGAALAYSVSRLIHSGAGAEERKKRNIEELKKEVEKRKKEAEKSNVDKDKFDKLVESLTMLLSNGKITPQESDGLIQGIKNGGTSYEFAFSFIEELLQE